MKKKKKSLIEPTPLEKDIQKSFTAIISSIPSSPERVKHIMPKIKKIEKTMKKKKAKIEIRRLMKQ